MKKIVSMVLAVALIMSACLMLIGCGNSSIDYANASYAELKKVDWNSKTVKYQFLNDRVDGYGAYWPVCLNLYTDGTAASWQATVTGFHVTHWADESKYLLWDFYGTWEETSDGIKLVVKGEGAELTSDFGSQKTPDLLEYTVKIGADGKADIPDYVLVASVGANITGLVSSNGSVQYKTFEDFFKSYEGEYSAE